MIGVANLYFEFQQNLHRPQIAAAVNFVLTVLKLSVLVCLSRYALKIFENEIVFIIYLREMYSKQYHNLDKELATWTWGINDTGILRTTSLVMSARHVNQSVNKFKQKQKKIADISHSFMNICPYLKIWDQEWEKKWC